LSNFFTNFLAIFAVFVLLGGVLLLATAYEFNNSQIKACQEKGMVFAMEFESRDYGCAVFDESAK
jgi:hypothetical protein